MIELYCEYLSVRCIWLDVIIMSCTRFRVNLQSADFTLKSVRDIIIIFSQIHRTGQSFWLVWLNDRVFVYEQVVVGSNPVAVTYKILANIKCCNISNTSNLDSHHCFFYCDIISRIIVLIENFHFSRTIFPL